MQTLRGGDVATVEIVENGILSQVSWVVLTLHLQVLIHPAELNDCPARH